MATSGTSASSPRQIPVKVTTAPTSVRPRRSRAASCAASNGSRWRRMLAVICAPLFRHERRSAPGHGGEESNLLRTRDRGIGLDMRPVDCGADHLRIVEGMRIFLAPTAEPVDQVGNSHYSRRQIDILLGLADALAYPGKISKFHVS